MDDIFGSRLTARLLFAMALAAGVFVFIAGVQREDMQLVAAGGAVAGSLLLAFVGYETLKVNQKLAQLAETAQERTQATFEVEQVQVELRSDGFGRIEFWLVNRGWQASGVRRVVIRIPQGLTEWREIETGVVRRRIRQTGADEEYPDPLAAGDRAIYRVPNLEALPRLVGARKPVLRVEALVGRAGEREFDYTREP